MNLELLSGSAAQTSYIHQTDDIDRTTCSAESDRRTHPRLSAPELRWLRSARLKNGSPVTLIDLSIGGVLIESDNRLCPGSTMALELVASSQIVVALRVVRAQIASLRAGPVYRGACAFRRPLELPDLLLHSSTATAPLSSEAAPPVPTASSDSAATPRSGASQVTIGWSMIILRYLDGRALKGFSNDFSASRTQFHLWPSAGGSSSLPMIVPLSGLKAVFFVRDFDGDPAYIERQTFATVPHGRKMEVTFLDGEVVVGSTLNYRPEGSGFFLCPADSRSNNVRIFVVGGSVRHARFL
jgi:hypothetical protein